MTREPNRQLAALLDEAGWSHAGVAKRVNNACALRECPRSYTATSVANWLGGMVPSDPVPRVLVELLTERLHRSVTLRSLGYQETLPTELGLVWHEAMSDTIGSVRRLWQADLRHDGSLAASGWIASGFTGPTREWLLDWAENEPAAHRGAGRRVGGAEVDVIWSMCHAFADSDHRLGGGHSRAALLHYFDDVALPLLDGVYDEATGRQLLAATARLCDLNGFMAFDSGAQGIAQRYYVQALRLAQASGDRALGAHILADMSMQAQHLGDNLEAVSLARVGRRSASESGSHSTLARCCAIEARAHAAAGDERQSSLAMNRAEDALDKVCVDDEPAWIRFFTVGQLKAEFTYAAHDLGKTKIVQRFAPESIAAATGMERRHVLLSSVLARSYLDTRNGRTLDIAQACATLKETAPLVRVVTSKRGMDAVNDVRTSLRAYADQDVVQELDAEYGPLSGSAR